MINRVLGPEREGWACAGVRRRESERTYTKRIGPDVFSELLLQDRDPAWRDPSWGSWDLRPRM
jgi:hypothetical protein